MDGCREFHGQRADRWSTDAAELSETFHAPRDHTGLHAHPGATVTFVVAGGFVERQGARTIACGPGALVARPTGLEHADRFSERGCVCFNVALGAPLTTDVAVGVSDRRLGEAAWIAQRLVASLRLGDALTVDDELAALVDALAPTSSARVPPRMARVARELAESFARPWSLAALAREADVHPVHFARAFRAAHGESVGERVQRLRVERAAHDLARTSKPLAEIASAAGFADQAHLTRIFRRRTGTTPARFRRSFGEARALRSFKTG